MKKIYVFRHGEVEEAFRTKIRGRRIDCDLSPEGKSMSLHNAKWLLQKKISHVITTGLQRTDYVGSLVIEMSEKIIHIVDPDLQEMDMGKWDGEEWDHVKEQFPKETTAFFQDPMSVKIPKAETSHTFKERILHAWKNALQKKGDIAIVSHGLVNMVLLQHITGRATIDMQKIGCMNEIHIDKHPQLMKENVILYPAENDRSPLDATH